MNKGKSLVNGTVLLVILLGCSSDKSRLFMPVASPEGAVEQLTGVTVDPARIKCSIMTSGGIGNEYWYLIYGVFDNDQINAIKTSKADRVWIRGSLPSEIASADTLIEYGAKTIDQQNAGARERILHLLQSSDLNVTYNLYGRGGEETRSGRGDYILVDEKSGEVVLSKWKFH